MKNRITGFGRKFTSVAVLLCLLFSIVAPTVIAADLDLSPKSETVEPGSKGDLNYVSIGDSMANGYGFEGYEQNNHANQAEREAYDLLAGKGVYGAGAYPLQFEDYLTEQGYNVKHTKLATSAMLPEDFLYFLGKRAEIDDGWHGVKDYIGSASDAEVSKYIQKAVKEADIMTIGLGNAAFGAFLLDRVTSALGVFGASLEGDPELNLEYALEFLDEEYTDDVIAFVDEFMATLDLEAIAEMLGAKYETVIDILEYTVASFIVNYKLVIETILEMNPDVEIVFVGLLNTIYGVEVDTGAEENFPLGDVMDEMFGMLNDYIRMIPTLVKADKKYPEATFKFAEQPEPKFICQVFDDLKDNNWENIDNGRLSGKIVRERNIKAYNDALRPMLSLAFAGLLGAELPEINLAMVQDLDSAAPNYSWVTTPDPTLYVVSTNIYLAFEDAVAECADERVLTLDGLVAIMTDIMSAFSGYVPDMDNLRGSLADYLCGRTGNENIRGMVKIYALFKVGNGMSVHPTPAGHDDIFATLKEVYEGEALEYDKKLCALRDVYFYLENNGYLTVAQALTIFAGAADMDTYALLDAVYNQVLKTNVTDDAERLEVIGNVYAILKGDVLGAYSPALDAVGNIYAALKADGLITEKQAFAVVDFVYECIIDGSVAEDIVSIIKFIYYTLFFTEAEVASAGVEFSLCAFEMPNIDELQSIGAGEKIAILNTVFAELKDSGYVTEDSTFAPMVELYENLAANGDISDEALAAVIDIAIETVIEKEEAAFDNVADLGFEIIEKVSNSDEIPAAAKEIVSKELYDTVNKMDITGNGESVIPGEVQCIIDRLYEKDLLTYTQVMQIVSKLRPLMSGEEIDAAVALAVVEDIANVVFNSEGITTQDRILIVLNSYTALKNAGYVTDEQLVEFITDYYYVALVVGFVYAYEEGYVDVAIEALDDATVAIENFDIDSLELSDELKAAVEAELDAIVNIINKVVYAADEAGNIIDSVMAGELPEEEIAELVDLIMSFEADVTLHIENIKNIAGIMNSESFAAIEDILKNDLIPEIEALRADIEENGLEYLKEALKEYGPAIGAAAWDAILATPEAVKSFVNFVNTYGVYVVNFFEEYGVEFVTIFGNIAVEYGFDVLGAIIDQGEEGLVALKDLIWELGAEAYDFIWIYADALDLTHEAASAIFEAISCIEQQITYLEGQLVILEGELAKLEAQLYEALEDIEDELRAKIAEIEAAIAEIKAVLAELYAQLEELYNEIKALVLEIADIVNAFIDLAKAFVSQSYDAIKDALENLADEFMDLLDRFLSSDSILNILNAIADKLAAISEFISEKLAEIANALRDLQILITETIKQAIEDLKNAIDEFVADLEEKLLALEAQIKKQLEALRNHIEEKLLIISIEIMNAVRNLKIAIEEAVAKAEALQAAVIELINNAFNADYVFDRGNSHYVALGDASAAEGVTSYVELIADYFNMNANHYTDLTGVSLGFTLEEALEVLGDYDSVISKADLITFNYNNTAVYEYVMRQAFSNTTDWSEIVGEEFAAQIDELLALATEEVAKLLEDNMDKLGDLGALTDLVTPEVIVNIVEAYAYAYVARIVTLHKIVAELHNVAPEALVVIVGAFNDFEGVEFEVEGVTIELGKYLNIVTEAVNASAFFCALFNENTIFVPVGSVETKLVYDAESELSVLEYAIAALTSPALLLPSDNGNATIANAILAALNIGYAEHVHVYDNRCDDTCNTCGDKRYAVHTYSNACDATCNICGYERDDAAAHVYDADCDDTCNVCGETRIAAAHTFGSWKTDREATYNVMGRKSRACTKCGYTEYERIPVLVAGDASADGVSAGVVVAITIPSVLALLAGGFSAYWVGYKKKTFKELGAILKKFALAFKK